MRGYTYNAYSGIFGLAFDLSFLVEGVYPNFPLRGIRDIDMFLYLTGRGM